MQAFLLSLLLAIAPVTPDGGVVGVKGQRFLAEVAATHQEQTRGLMYRKTLERDRCMFFVYDTDGYRPIWMKNCLIALDVVWLDADGKVVEIVERVPPLSPMFNGPDQDAPTYGGKVLSRHFVEFSVGTVKRLKLKLGDRLGWDIRLVDGTEIRGGLPVPAGKVRK